MPRLTTGLRSAVAVAVAAAAAVLLAACSADAPVAEPSAPAGSTIAPGTTGSVTVDDRRFSLTVPEGAEQQLPLVVGLHGYTSNGLELAEYLGLRPQADAEGFLLAVPEGTTDARGEQFWNASNACCDFDDTGVDDSAYLAEVIRTVQEQHEVDPAAVYVVGHSNGGFMALRMACDHADLVTAVVSIAGAHAQDPAQCDPVRPVSVLQVHGSADETIAYDGGANGPGRGYPGAAETVTAWRELDGCAEEPADGQPLDLEAARAGAETAVRTWSGCAEGTEVALWTIGTGRHGPTWTDGAPGSLVGWLLDHRREG